MNEKQPFFSVIMPVYNAENTVNTAIGSILTQTFSDYEFIIIENGSTDKSLNIARAYEAAFPKLRVLQSEQKGVSHARNMGLDEAKGEYVVFLDADDHYVFNALETMHAALDKSGADLLLAGILDFPMHGEDGTLAAIDPRLLYLDMLDPPAYRAAVVGEENRLLVEFSSRHQCSRAYSRRLIKTEGLRFDERCSIYVDFLFYKSAYSVCKSPYLIYKRLYRYNTVSGSITRRGGADLIENKSIPFLLIAEEAGAFTGEDRSAHIYALFRIIASMLDDCACDGSGEAYEALMKVLGTSEAKMVVSELRSDYLHILPKNDALLKELLVLLRNDDVDGALRLLKGFREKR